MMENKLASAALVALLSTVSCAVSAPEREDLEARAGLAAESGILSVLVYNVAGLPELLSSSDPSENTPLIGPLLEGFDLVNVQEDFNYHGVLYANNDHPFRSSTSGGVPFGDGLNTLSYYPFMDFQRVKWGSCNGTDCLTPKGFSLARHRLAAGVYLDVYNLHSNAGTTENDLEARRANVLQLARFIEESSASNAVVVMGDTNTRYTRSGDNIRELTDRGFTDVWVHLIRGGEAPVQGAPGLTDCAGGRTSPSCEVVDKILFRNNRFISLTPLSYRVEDGRFVRPDGGPLSDHYAISATFHYDFDGTLRLSDTIGGPHGTAFNDVGSIPETPVVRRIALGSGSRVDRVSLELSTGAVLSHGGSGGTERALSLSIGEYAREIFLCSGKKNGHTRIFYAEFQTNLGRTLSGGSRTETCTSFVADPSWQIVGFHGRSGANVDKLGVIYAPVP